MSLYATISLLGTIAVLESTLLTRVEVAALRPDLMLLAVIAWSFLRGSRAGAIWGFVGGLMTDLLSGVPLGLNALLLCLTGYLSGLGEARVFRSNVLLPGVIVGVLTVLYLLAEVLLLQGVGRLIPAPDALLQLVITTSAVNLLWSPLVLYPLRQLSRRVARESSR